MGEELDGFGVTNDDKDSVSVNSNREASVAEAKPVGLAIAGPGGVASSKPSATAVVGPGGLAIARPSAVAIAGVSPNDVSNLGIPIPQKKIIRKDYSPLSRMSGTGTFAPVPKYGLTMMQTPYGDVKVLVGPDFKDPNQVAGVKENNLDYLKSTGPTTEEEEYGEILAEDYSEEAKDNKAKESVASGVTGVLKHQEPMAVAPEEQLLNRYPLIPPKYSAYARASARNNPKTSLNPLFYQPLPYQFPSAPNFNYNPYANLPFQNPLYIGL